MSAKAILVGIVMAGGFLTLTGCNPCCPLAGPQGLSPVLPGDQAEVRTKKAVKLEPGLKYERSVPAHARSAPADTCLEFEQGAAVGRGSDGLWLAAQDTPTGISNVIPPPIS